MAVLACVAYFYFRPSHVDKIVEEDVLRFRRVRFERYQSSESGRTGPGEQGQGVHLTGAEKEKADSLMDKEAFNIVASDKISLERSVKDVRDHR